jgi:predicted Kef-type K+ transport protein
MGITKLSDEDPHPTKAIANTNLPLKMRFSTLFFLSMLMPFEPSRELGIQSRRQNG